jgi:hypothetical protein
MKKQLLFTALLLSATTQAQQLDYSNEPAIGDNQLMYLLDTLTPTYSTTTGSGVTWDFQNILGLNAETRVIEIIDATTTANAGDFPSSTKAMAIQGSITNYWSTTPTERTSQGFVYEEPNFGTVIAKFDVNEETTVQYPFANGASFADAFEGQLSFSFNGLPQNPTCTGMAHAYVDGQGTMLFPNSLSVPNVIRYKMIDTVFTQINFIGVMDIEIVRTQYEYYDVANNTLPLLIHTTIAIEQAGSSTPIVSQTNVVSLIQPLGNLGVSANKAAEFTVYPNPSEGMITFKGAFAANASATIFDQTGRLVHTIENLSNGTIADLSALNKGMYTVVISSNDTKTTQNVVIK